MKQIRSTGRRLRSLRAAAHLTQAELAARAGLTLRDIQRMEQGMLNLPCRKFAAVAAVLGTDVDALLWEEVAA